MAIRIEHQAAAGLIGSYAAGQAASRRRGQKYILDLSRDSLRYRQRLGGRLGVGRRAGAAQALGGKWTDPLADDAALTPQERVQRKAARARRDRQRSLGQADRPEWKPTYKSPEEIEADAAIAADKLDWQRRGAAALAGREQAGAMQEDRQAEVRAAIAAENQRKYATDQATAAQGEIDAGQYPTLAEAVGKAINNVNKVMGSKLFTDPGKQAEALEDAIEELEELRGKATDPPTRDDRLRKAIGDAAFEKYGDAPWMEDKDGKWSLPSNLPEDPEAKAAEAAKELAEEQKAAQDEYKKEKRKDDKEDFANARDLVKGGAKGADGKVLTLPQALKKIKAERKAAGLELEPPVVEAEAGSEGFDAFYKDWAQQSGIDPNPDDPRHKYNYRAAYEAGARPKPGEHWPSEFKAQDHPNRFVDGVDTITGEPGQFGNEQVPSDEAILGDLVPDAPAAALEPSGEPIQDAETFTPPQPGQPVPRPDLMRLGTVEERKAAYSKWQQDVTKQKYQQQKFEEYRKDPAKAQRRHAGDVKMRRELAAGKTETKPQTKAESLSPAMQSIQSEVKQMEHEMATLIDLKNAGIATPEDEFKLQHLMDRRQSYLRNYKRLKGKQK